MEGVNLFNELPSNVKKSKNFLAFKTCRYFS